MGRARVALCAAMLALGAASTASAPAWAFTPPALQGRVTDTAGKLSAEDRAYIEQRLADFQQRTGYQVVVLVAGSLDGESIDDAAYTTFNAWRLGERGLDNGVLLMIAPTERRVRIETGRGVEGDLTDLESNDIIRNRIAPALREDRFRDAIVAGTDAIATALTREHPQARPLNAQRKPQPEQEGGRVSALFVLFLLLFVFLAFRRRRGGFPVFIPWGGGGGWGGGDGGGWGGGGGGDAGPPPFSGGGGESGGGGSSDSY